MDFQKSDFNKAELPRICQFCQSDLPFTIVQSPLYAPFRYDDLVMFGRNKGLVPQGERRISHFAELVNKLRKNIFGSTIKLTDEYYSKQRKFLADYKTLRQKLIEENLEVFLHVGRSDDYFSAVSIIVQDKFRAKYQALEVEFKEVNDWQRLGRISSGVIAGKEYYEGSYLRIGMNDASLSREELTKQIFEKTSLTRITPQGWRRNVDMNFTRRTRALVSEVVDYLEQFIPNNMDIFQKNMNENSPAGLDEINHPKNFFQLGDMSHGVEYCGQCGVEQLRGLLVKMDFYPINNREKLTYEGKVADIEKGFVQVINKIYQKHLDELNDRIDRYVKLVSGK